MAVVQKRRKVARFQRAPRPVVLAGSAAQRLQTVRGLRSGGGQPGSNAPSAPNTSVVFRISRAPAPLVVPRETTYQAQFASSLAAQSRTATVNGKNVSGIETGGFAGGGGFGGTFGNLAHDALSVVTGIPSLGILVAKNANAAALETSGASSLGRAGVPGFGWTRGLTASAIRSDTIAAKSMALDYKTRWGPLFRGDFGEFKRQAQLHPGLFLLDLGAAWSGAGSAVRLGAESAVRAGLASEAGTAARLAERGVLPAGEIAPGATRASTGARYQPRVVRELRLGENAPAASKVYIDQRPLSGNPLTRAVQTRVTKPLRANVSKILEEQGNLHRAGESGRLIFKPFSSVSRYNRAATRVGKDMRYHAELDKAQQVRNIVEDFIHTSRQYGDKSVHHAAIYLHTRDLLNVPGLSHELARQNVIKFMREGLDQAVTKRESASRGAQHVIQAIADVPTEHLNLATAPPELQAAVAAAKRVASEATRRRIEAGTLTAEQAQQAARRAAEQVHGGSRYDPNFIRPTERLQGAQERLSAAVQARDQGPRLTPFRAMRRGYQAGKKVGRGERNVEIAPKLNQNYYTPKIPNPGRFPEGDFVPLGFGRSGFGVKGGARVRRTKGPGITASAGRGYLQQAAGRRGLYHTRTGLLESGRLQREVNAARREVTLARREAKGGWTAPSRTDIGHNAVYFPDRPASRLTGVGVARQTGSTQGAMGKLTRDKIHERHGTLFGMGNVSIDPRNLISAVEQSLVDQAHPKFVETMVKTFAFRDPKTNAIVTGDRAIEMMRADANNVVLASRKSLEDAMRVSRNTPEGHPITNPFAGMEADGTMISGPEGLSAIGPEAKNLGDLVALPKAAVDAVKVGYNDPIRIPLYDTPLQLWRRGILAFAPRWYLNNLFGNTLQYGLLTGFDYRSLLQARKMAVRGTGMERSAGSTLVNDVRMSDPTRAVSAARRAYEDLSNKGMDFNQKLESTIRQAAYISRSKAAMRAEGVPASAIRKMSTEDLGAAIENMPYEMKVQVLREVELFMGDYVRMTSAERAVLKRLFPFYSWMRVIGKLMGSMPFRYPKRTELMAVMAQAATASENPNDFMLPVYDRGRLPIPGTNIVLRSMGSNPFATHAALISDLATGSPSNVIGGLAQNITPIGGQQAVQLTTHNNVFGRPFTAPPGWNGSVGAYGQELQKLNPATGLYETYYPTPSIGEMLFQTLPLVPQVARGLASMGNRPYDVVDTPTLIAHALSGGGYDPNLFQPPSQNAAPSTPVPFAPLFSVIGASAQIRNQAAEVARYQRDQANIAKAQAYTAKRKAKLGVR